MNNQVYLLLVRGSDALPKSPAAIGVALKGLLKDMIRGDSLDAPYINFIRVSSIGQSIGGIKSEYDYDAAAMDLVDVPNTVDGNQAGSEFLGRLKSYLWARQHRDAATSSAFNSGGLQSHLPTQGTLTFNKQLDGATPQLAYGCSTQEPFRFALFLVQRRAAPNLGGSSFRSWSSACTG